MIALYLIGHVALAMFVYFLYEQIKGIRNDRNKIIVAIGSMLPDFLDKPIGSLIFNRGRWLGHNVLFQFTIFLILSLIWYQFKLYPKLKNDRLILYLGATLHLVGDFPGIALETLFWPLLGPFPATEQTSFLLGFQSTRIILSELIGMIVITSIGIKEQWPKRYWKIMVTTLLVYVIGYISAYWLLVR